MVKVLDEAGNTIEELPPPWGWQNYIGDMAVTEGYRIKVSADASLTTIGSPVALPIDIPLYAPWNIMGYPLTVGQDGIDVVQSLIDAGVLVKVLDEAGNTIEELPPPWGWQNYIGDFLPGEGYRIKVSEDANLTLDELSRDVSSLSRVVGVSQEPDHFTIVWSGNPYQVMNFFVANYATIDDVDISPGDEIGIFDGEYCVGVGILTEVIEGEVILPIIAGEDDPGTPEIDGFTHDNPISYKLWDASEDIELEDVIAEYTEFGEFVIDGFFESLGTAMITVAGASVSIDDFDNILPSEFVLHQNYPNPFNPSTTIRFDVPEENNVNIIVYDMLGREVRTLISSFFTPSVYSVVWDGTNNDGNVVPNGIYFYRMVSGEFIQVRKLVFLK